MKEVLIVEKHKKTRAVLENIVRQVDAGARIFSMANEEEAYAISLRVSIDVFLIDVALHPGKRGGDQSGAELAYNIRNIEKYQFTPIIIISDLYDLKLTMYSDVHCYKFVEKPFDVQMVRKALQKAIRYRTDDSRDRSVFFHINGMLEAVCVKDIKYAFNRGKKLHVGTSDGVYIIPYKSCISLLEELDSDYFLQCSRQSFVNVWQIRRIDPVNRYIYIKGDDTVLEIGTVMKKKFMERIRRLIPIMNINSMIRKERKRRPNRKGNR